MLRSKMEVAQWIELTRIARVEILLDKIGDLLEGLDMERSAPMFMFWEEETEQNLEALEHWLLWINLTNPRDEWLSSDFEGAPFGDLDQPPDR